MSIEKAKQFLELVALDEKLKAMGDEFTVEEL